MLRKILLGLTLFFVFALSFSGIARAQSSSGPPVAIISAIEFYSGGWAWRPDAIKDANQIAWILSNHGFEVIRLYGSNANKKELMIALEKATSKAGPEGKVLFYFSGHAVKPESDTDNEYIVPYGAEVGKDDQLIPVSLIKSEVMDYVQADNTLFLFDTGSTLEKADPAFGTVQELATALKDGLGGNADKNNSGTVEFPELAAFIRPKAKSIKIHVRSAEDIVITETEVIVKSTKIPKKRGRGKQSRERYRPDQFDKLLEIRMEENFRKMERIQQKIEHMDKEIMDPRRLPLPR